MGFKAGDRVVIKEFLKEKGREPGGTVAKSNDIGTGTGIVYVIKDEWVGSEYEHQICFFRDDELELQKAPKKVYRAKIVFNKIIIPAKTVYVEAPTKEALKRKIQRNEHRSKEISRKFKVYEIKGGNK